MANSKITHIRYNVGDKFDQQISAIRDSFDEHVLDSEIIKYAVRQYERHLEHEHLLESLKNSQ